MLCFSDGAYHCASVTNTHSRGLAFQVPQLLLRGHVCDDIGCVNASVGGLHSEVPCHFLAVSLPICHAPIKDKAREHPRVLFCFRKQARDLLIFFILCVCFVSVCVCLTCLPGTLRRQKRMSELQLQKLVICCMGAGLFLVWRLSVTASTSLGYMGLCRWFI